MKLRYGLVLSATIVLGIISAAGASYEMIGKGGENRIGLNIENKTNVEDKSLYEIRLGMPDISDFRYDLIRGYENLSVVKGYLRNEVPRGHIFQFQGQLKVSDCAYCRIWFHKPAGLISESIDGVTCEQQYREPLTCHVASGYLVDEGGNLHSIKGLNLLPDANKSAWIYLGYGYLVRVRHLDNRSNNTDSSIVVPDPGGYIVTWSDVKLRPERESAVNESAEAETPNNVKSNDFNGSAKDGSVDETPGLANNVTKNDGNGSSSMNMENKTVETPDIPMPQAV